MQIQSIVPRQYEKFQGGVFEGLSLMENLRVNQYSTFNNFQSVKLPIVSTPYDETNQTK